MERTKFKEVEGRGTTVAKTKDDQQRFIFDVLYVPQIVQNLLSVCQLLDKGYRVTFNAKKCLIIVLKKGHLIFKAKMAQDRTFSIIIAS